MGIFISSTLRNILFKEDYPVDLLQGGYSRQRDAYISLDVDKGLVVVEENSGKTTVGKPAAILRRMLFPMVAEVLPDVMFENIANRVKAVASLSKGRIEIWEADRIPEAYLWSNYADEDEVDIGSLAMSCMRHEECQNNLWWYKAIGEGIVQIAVLVRDSDSKILGRALVWNLPNGRIFMDRAYGSDATRELFKNYALEQGWWKRTKDSYEEGDRWISPEGTKMQGVDVEIPIPRTERMVTNVPYVDTFYYIDPERGVLTNTHHRDKWGFMLRTLTGLPDPNYELLQELKSEEAVVSYFLTGKKEILPPSPFMDIEEGQLPLFQREFSAVEVGPLEYLNPFQVR